MQDENDKPEFWEAAFTSKQEMWGFEPAASAVLAKDLFLERHIKSVLVPGIGYGRNAAVFLEAGMQVTGIEISQTAIEMAQQHYGKNMTIYHGSVTEMPFDARQYDAISCYGLIYLLDAAERRKLIADCYAQLQPGGTMVFTAITKEAVSYGKGRQIGKDRFEQHGGAHIFFCDRESIADEFSNAGLYDVSEVAENFPFYLVQCRKPK